MGRIARRTVIAFAVTGGLLPIFLQPASGAEATRSGDTFRISLAPQSGLGDIDPALSYTAPGWALLDTTCARLMTYPDKPPPAAFRLEPEVAAGFPTVSRDLKTYTFTLRSGFRFSDGKPVRASAFARAINRTLAPEMHSPGAVHTRDIVGAADVLAGRRSAAAGVEARGNTLVVRLRRPAPDFLARTTLPFFCAVPPNMPAHHEIRSFPGAGPYYVAEYRPGERLVILRNRFYGGKRPHHVDGFDVDLRAASPTEMIQRIDRGEADWGHTVAGVFLDPALGLVDKHGLNRSRFFVKPGLTLRMFVFNSSRPLFGSNPKLRQAVNLALDRTALMASAGGAVAGTPTDQYLPPVVPGFRNADIYPLDGPDLQRARELARGNLRQGRAVLYTANVPQAFIPAQLAKQQLAEIGLEVVVEPLPIHIATATYLERLSMRGEPWDLALVLWSPNLPDAYAYLNLLLEGRFVGRTNITGFASSGYDGLMRRAARLPGARARNRAYGDLDVRLARDAAPLAALNVVNEATLVSARVGCVVLRPVLDLTAVCLK
jgi:peptide/nickel transport system substrate-binding protein